MAHRGVRTLVEVSGLAFLGLLLGLAISGGVAAASAHSVHRIPQPERPFKQRLLTLAPAHGSGGHGRGDGGGPRGNVSRGHTALGGAHPAGAGRVHRGETNGRTKGRVRSVSDRSSRSADRSHEYQNSVVRSESDSDYSDRSSERSSYYEFTRPSPARRLREDADRPGTTNDQPDPDVPARPHLDAVGSDGSSAGTSGGASPPGTLDLAASLSGPPGVRSRLRYEYGGRLAWNSARPLVRPG
jgi:hypothetical protein